MSCSTGRMRSVTFATTLSAERLILTNRYLSQIHASTINTDPEGSIRVGTDLRFVDSSRPWDTRWNNHFEFGDGV